MKARLDMILLGSITLPVETDTKGKCWLDVELHHADCGIAL